MIWKKLLTTKWQHDIIWVQSGNIDLEVIKIVKEKDKKVRLVARVLPLIKDKAKVLADSMGCSISDVAAFALKEYLQKQEK